MLTIKLALGIAATVLGITCFIPYIKDIFRGTTKPHSYTWLVWSLIQVVASVIMFYDGAGIGILPLAVGALLCGYIFVLSLGRGTKNITFFDTMCFIGALVAIVVYVFFHNATFSIVLLCLIDFLGFLPTIRKAYAEPKTETISTYLISALSSALAILALSNYTFITVVYLALLVVLDTSSGVIIIFRRKVV